MWTIVLGVVLGGLIAWWLIWRYQVRDEQMGLIFLLMGVGGLFGGLWAGALSLCYPGPWKLQETIRVDRGSIQAVSLIFRDSGVNIEVSAQDPGHPSEIRRYTRSYAANLQGWALGPMTFRYELRLAPP